MIFEFFQFLFFSHSAALEDVRSRHHHRRSHHHYAHHAKETSATEVEKATPTSSILTNVTSVKVMPLTEGKGPSIYYVNTYGGRSGLLKTVVFIAGKKIQQSKYFLFFFSLNDFKDEIASKIQFRPT